MVTADSLMINFICRWTTFWAWRTYCGEQRVWRDTRRKLSDQLTISCRIRAPSLKRCEHSKCAWSGLLTSCVIRQESDHFTFLRIMKKTLLKNDLIRLIMIELSSVDWRKSFGDWCDGDGSVTDTEDLRHYEVNVKTTSLRRNTYHLNVMTRVLSPFFVFSSWSSVTRRLNFFVSWCGFCEIGTYTRIWRRR